MKTPAHVSFRASLLLLMLAGVVGAFAAARDKYRNDADRLAVLLNWHEGSVVADVGAGAGEMAEMAAKRVGPAGRVYATELDAGKRAHLDELAAQEKNMTVLEAGIDRTNLPPRCCDSIYMRLVYHHLTKPAAIDASLLESLKPGGLLAVVDEEPQPGTSPVPGVPVNRRGHGVPEKIVIEELTATGFQLVKTYDRWPVKHYCAIFRKPSM